MATISRVWTSPTIVRANLSNPITTRAGLSAVVARSLVGIRIRLLDESGQLLTDENDNIIIG